MRQTKPNIVLIVADDLGRADVGFMGATEIKTPHLDSLARGGATLTSFYAQPVCSPTRAALLTGRYPTSTGVYTIVRPGAPWGLPTGERTLAGALKEAGYETAIVGKWHLGETSDKYRPLQRGFDYQYGNLFGALDYFTHKRGNKHDWFENEKPSKDEGYTTHLLARKAVALIEKRKSSRPLFLYLPFNAVHGPFQVPDAYKKPYAHLKGDRQTYAGMIAAMDEAVGQVVQALKVKGMYENTLFVFLSDNGGPYPNVVTKNAPLRAGKGTIYEGGVRVCAFAHWAGKIPAGRTIEAPCHAIDWFPTLLKLAGGSASQPLSVDGKDLWPLLTGQTKSSPHDAVLLCGLSPKVVGVRKGDWKLLLNPSDHDAEEAEETGKTGLRRGPNTPVELYDLKSDPSETTNLAEKNLEKAKELRRYLEETWMNRASKPAARKT